MSQKQAQPGTIIINLRIPIELADWMDYHVAKLRVSMIRSGKHKDRTIPLPTRNNYVRWLIERARTQQQEQE